MKKPLLILGASGHAAVLADAAQASGFSVIGFVADRPSSCGLSLIGDESDISRLCVSHVGLQIIVAIGDNHLRRTVVTRLTAKHPSLSFATVAHPSAVLCEGSVLRPGAFIAAGSVVGVAVQVGCHAIVNTNASLDHHATLGDFASLSPAAAAGGNARIESGAAIGMGALVHHGVCIGANTVLGSLSLANKNLPDCVVAYGNPARVISSRKPGDKYL